MVFAIENGDFIRQNKNNTNKSKNLIKNMVTATPWSPQIQWDKYCFTLNSQPIVITAGEFHYWRIPDENRWKSILTLYRKSGFNAIRIYIHWGYHSPQDGKFIFDGNRDLQKILTICEELGLYVLIACGPYICAETSAGGFPLWMVANRKIRVKNNVRSFKTKYDPEYMRTCKDWYGAVINQIKGHQITVNPKGCVIAFQIENEYIEKQFFHANGQYMQELVKYAREFGLTIPLFHDDAMEFNSWNNLVDLYGFNRYVIFAPKTPKQIPLAPWSPKTFMNIVDKAEEKVRKMGGHAASGPLLIPETQGGWFNHWTVKYGYDELYSYYGDTFQKLVAESYTAQGVGALCFYMGYGGTNWAAISNPEVYTSYDYSAMIREYGYQSNKSRQVRLFTLFRDAFMADLLRTDVFTPLIKSTPEDILFKARKSVDTRMEFYFCRNFNSEGKNQFKFNLENGISSPKSGEITLATKDIFIATGNFSLGDTKVVFCGLPIVLKGVYADGMILGCIYNGGEIILEGTNWKAEGIARSEIEQNLTRISICGKGTGCIRSVNGKEGSKIKPVYLMVFTEEEALTLNAIQTPTVKAAWGAYGIFFSNSQQIEIETHGSQTISLLSNSATLAPGFTVIKESAVPFLSQKEFGRPLPKNSELPQPKWNQWENSESNLAKASYWKQIDFATQRDPLDHGFMSGHILYKCEFKSSNTAIKLKLNIRNRCGIWVDGTCVGGHYSYNFGLFMTGSMNGPDPSFLGTRTYDLGAAMKKDTTQHTLIILVESFGQSKQFWLFNDCRNPRGILDAQLSPHVEEPAWFIAGIDVRTLDNSYTTLGFPEELMGRHRGEGDTWKTANQAKIHDNQSELTISPNDQISWYRNEFTWEKTDTKKIPLCLNLNGQVNAIVYVNGWAIARYWGEKGPQHAFYLPEGIIQNGKNRIVIATWTTKADLLKVQITPYLINTQSGNLDSQKGVPFITETFNVTL